jgi:hypothetical protein
MLTHSGAELTNPLRAEPETQSFMASSARERLSQAEDRGRQQNGENLVHRASPVSLRSSFCAIVLRSLTVLANV